MAIELTLQDLTKYRPELSADVEKKQQTELTLEDLKKYKRPTSVSEFVTERLPEAIISGAEKIRAPEIAGGILQGGASAATSLANLPLEAINYLAGTHLNIPHPDLGKYVRKDPLSRAAFFGGEAAGSISPYFGLMSALGKIRKPASLIEKAMHSGAVSGAIGEHSPGEFSSRAAPAAIGAASGLASELSAPKIVGNIKDYINKAETISKQKYDSVFNALKNAGIHENEMRVPTALRNFVKSDEGKSIPIKQRRMIQRFINNPTFENAHDAQSILNKFGNSAITNKTQDIDKLAYAKARDMVRRVRGSQAQFLTENMQEPILHQYVDATRHYAKTLGPLQHSALDNLNKSGKTLKSILEAEGKSADRLKEKLYEISPGYGTRETIEPIVKLAKKTGGTAATLGLGYELGIPGTHYLAEIIGK